MRAPTSGAPVHTGNIVVGEIGGGMTDVSIFRLYLMRAMYLLIFLGQGSIQLPRIIHHASALTFSFWDGVGTSLLAALALVAGLGIRYPMQMLPLLLFELVWKTIWLSTVALPLWSANRIDADTLESVPSILMGLVLLIVIPWRHVVARYVRMPAERWR
jgi:hypothetical protein